MAGGPLFGAAARPEAAGHANPVYQPQRQAALIPLGSGERAVRHHPARTQHQAGGPGQSGGGRQASAQSQAGGQGGAGQHQAAARHPGPAGPIAPYLIYDSVTPSAIPPHHVVATYANGRYAASPAQLAGRGQVLWIDVFGTNPGASVLDVEPGDATPSMAASWAFRRLSAQPDAVARLYTMRSEWPAVQAAVGTLPAPMRSHVRYWIADPTGVPHVVPGSHATQWYWGSKYDISTATPNF
jgi:hypothetical protein